MNDNAKKWVEALRSGEFEQATNAMRTEDGYCCLGVACELHRREFGGEWVVTADYDEFTYLGMAGSYLPREVTDWLGLASPAAPAGDGDATLAQKNDDGASFAEIADIIESEPEGLFA